MIIQSELNFPDNKLSEPPYDRQAPMTMVADLSKIIISPFCLTIICMNTNCGDNNSISEDKNKI